MQCPKAAQFRSKLWGMKSPVVASAVVLSLLIACSASDSEPNPTPANDASTSDVSTDKDAGADTSLPPPNTDPEQMVADKVADCVGTYTTTAPKEGSNKNFSVAGQSRSFELLLPPSSFTGPRPLFVGFHGTNGSGEDFIRSAKLAEFQARGFVVLSPDAVGNGTVWPVWDAMRAPTDEARENKDLEFFDKMVRCTAAHYNLDKKRLYIGGHSAGGHMSNRVLRARSEMLAGAIIASGIWSLTAHPAALNLEQTFALVTWGGDNDRYSGTTPNGVNVPNISFVEQASLASKFYEKQPSVGQIYCRGNNLGHAWLPINNWYIDTLLQHPKGLGNAPGMLPLPANVADKGSCSESSYDLAPLPDMVCKTSTKASCQAACQLMADCAVENRTVGTVLQNQLQTIGFSATSCDGCVAKCEQTAASASNTAALSCLETEQAAAQCGPGIEGSYPMLIAINKCCKDRGDSTFCVGLCQTLMENDAASSFFPTCAAILPQ